MASGRGQFEKRDSGAARLVLHSLRSRVTLALLVTGLVSAAVVGLVARTVVLQRFDRLMLDASFDRFQADVVAYVAQYGSWDAAVAIEPFGDFSRRRNAPPINGAAPARPLPGAAPVVNAGADATPFRFLLLDAAGQRVLLGPDEYARGKPVEPALRREARPIEVNGRVAALAIPLRQPDFSAYDDSYLDAMQHAMLYGVGTAALLALGLGFFFGERLSRNVRALTEAMGAIGKGELRQRVDVRTRDEVGLMASVFNRMSEDLAESHAQIRAQAALLKELSIHDDLTGLHNRRHFDEQAANAYSRARRYGQPLTVMICDVDHFKRVNDQCSHGVGDAVLAQLGRLLRATMRDSDIVARYGGDEFVVVFPQTGLAQATALCERIREQIAEFDWGAVHPHVTVTLSIGLDGDLGRGGIDAMLVAADARLYEAKAKGRNRVVGDRASSGSVLSA